MGMEKRRLGKTGLVVSEVGLGTWALGSGWGDVSEKDALRTLHAAVDEGINFFDTADVYGFDFERENGEGRCERLLGRFRRERSERLFVATKIGSSLNPPVENGYRAANLRASVERSLENLQTDSLDLLQLHCPPTEIYYRPEVFAELDALKAEGLLQHYGVSVHRVEEALKAIEYPGVAAIQIVFNMFRQRPAELFFERAQEKDVGILARVPLASGLLSGKMTGERRFAENDHRHFNRHGEAFNVGDTFAGVDFETGLAAVDELRELVPEGVTLAQFALRWILKYEAVTSVIPGAKSPAQVRDNVGAAHLPELSEEAMAKVRAIYEAKIAPLVHQRW